MRKATTLLLMLLVSSGFSTAQKKKEPKEQTLPQLREPPVAVVANTDRLVFRVSPLSAKGLLSQQVRDGLKVLLKNEKDEPLVKLRAFTAGSGDTRRVQTVLSETLKDTRLPMPALSVAQVGALPLIGAQVVIESIAVAKKPVNPNGLAFISGQRADSVEKSAADLRTALAAGGMQPVDVLRVGCFLSSLDNSAAIHEQLRADFPSAAVTVLQIQRVALGSAAECEAVARLRAPIDAPVKALNPGGLASTEAYSQMVLVRAPKLALTGAQLAFGKEPTDVRRAFQRLQKDLDTVHASLKDTVVAHMYALSHPVAGQVAQIRFDFYDRDRPPAGTILQLEGLPSMDATFAVDVVAVVSGQ